MKPDRVQSFATRVTGANRSELIVILYEIILEDIQEAIEKCKNDDIEGFKKDLRHSQKFITELIVALDFQYIISYDLLQLYLYVNKSIITAVITQKAESLESALKVMESLYVGFQGVAKEDTSESVMQNAQQLYAGLTYGRGVLNETYLDPKEHARGFKA